MICAETFALNTQNKTYNKLPKKKEEGDSSKKNRPLNPSPPPPSNDPLTIDKHSLDIISHPPKITLWKSFFNPNA